MLVYWLIFGVLCLTLLYFVVGDLILEPLQMKREFKQNLSSVRQSAAMQGVDAKDRRNAQKIANDIKFRMGAPVLDMVSSFILPEEFEKLKNNPMGANILMNELEPFIQKFINNLRKGEEEEAEPKDYFTP